MLNNIAVDRHERQWTIKAVHGERTYGSEILVSRGGTPDPRVRLDRDGPLVGKLAPWGCMLQYTATPYAIIYVDGLPTERLLRDWTGYPWVRTPIPPCAHFDRRT